jgi:hypothetical protein
MVPIPKDENYKREIIEEVSDIIKMKVEVRRKMESLIKSKMEAQNG